MYWLKRRFQLRPRLRQLLVLYLQFDLVHFQFVHQALQVSLCFRKRPGFLRAFAQYRFRLAAQIRPRLALSLAVLFLGGILFSFLAIHVLICFFERAQKGRGTPAVLTPSERRIGVSV